MVILLSAMIVWRGRVGGAITALRQQHHHHQQCRFSNPTIQQTEERKQLVACKIYMNTGGDKSHVPVLNDLILRAQTAFAKSEVARHQQRTQQHISSSVIDNGLEDSVTKDFTHVGALVQAYMDPLSNRSSFHLAGPVKDVIDVAKDLIRTAVTELRDRKRGCKLPPETTARKAAHKLIDIVEHVSLLPLLPGDQARITDRKNLYPPLWVPTYNAYAARQIGIFLREILDIQVFFYGFAQRKNLSFLETVDRRVKYFNSKNQLPESAFVGAFDDYIEDVHIVLAAKSGKLRMKELVKLLNNEETGLADIEATAQLYDVFRWDIHCRLLRPHLTGANMAAVEYAVKRWNQLQQGRNDQKEAEFVVKCFRVGPTYEECLNALQKVYISDDHRKEHDQEVMKSFQDFASYYVTSNN
jgi:hypothetical protein